MTRRAKRGNTDYSKITDFWTLSPSDQNAFRNWYYYHKHKGREKTVADFLARGAYSTSDCRNNGRPSAHGAPAGTPPREKNAHRWYCARHGDVPFAEWRAGYVPRNFKFPPEKRVQRVRITEDELTDIADRVRMSRENIEAKLPEHLRRRIA